MPPAATSYLGPQQGFSVESWLSRTEPHTMPRGRPSQGGIWGYTLCGPCNNWTGSKFAAEHANWVQLGRACISGLPGQLGGHAPEIETVADALEFLDSQLGWATFDVLFKDVDAGRFVRQVLTMMCTVAGPWKLAERQPLLRRIILNQECLPMPTPLTLGLTLYVGSVIRFVPPTLRGGEGGWSWQCELAYPPFSYTLVLAAEKESPPVGLDLGDLTRVAPGHRRDYSGTVQVSFGHTPFPGDFRTRAQLEAEAS